MATLSRVLLPLLVFSGSSSSSSSTFSYSIFIIFIRNLCFVEKVMGFACKGLFFISLTDEYFEIKDQNRDKMTNVLLIFCSD